MEYKINPDSGRRTALPRRDFLKLAFAGSCFFALSACGERLLPQEVGRVNGQIYNGTGGHPDVNPEAIRGLPTQATMCETVIAGEQPAQVVLDFCLNLARQEASLSYDLPLDKASLVRYIGQYRDLYRDSGVAVGYWKPNGFVENDTDRPVPELKFVPRNTLGGSAAQAGHRSNAVRIADDVVTKALLDQGLGSGPLSYLMAHEVGHTQGITDQYLDQDYPPHETVAQVCSLEIMARGFQEQRFNNRDFATFCLKGFLYSLRSVLANREAYLMNVVDVDKLYEGFVRKLRSIFPNEEKSADLRGLNRNVLKIYSVEPLRVLKRHIDGDGSPNDLMFANPYKQPLLLSTMQLLKNIDESLST